MISTARLKAMSGEFTILHKFAKHKNLMREHLTKKEKVVNQRLKNCSTASQNQRTVRSKSPMQSDRKSSRVHIFGLDQFPRLP